MKHLNLMAALVAAFELFACEPVDSGDAPRTATETQKVLNGSNENDFGAVCALIAEGANDRFDVHASGVLVDSEWVLSIASNTVLDAMEDDDILKLRFAFGPNVNDSETVKIAEVDRVVRFPYMLRGWNFLASEYPGEYELHYNNIALWHLKTPISDITPMVISDAPKSEWQDQALTLVGYGSGKANFRTSGGFTSMTGERANTDGERLSTEISVSHTRLATNLYGSNMLVKDPSFAAAADRVGPAYGDGGAPLFFVNGEDEYELVGLVGVSNFIGENPSEILREFKGWITSVIADTPMDCKSDPSICSCPEACMDDGVCNNWDCNYEHFYDGCYELYQEWNELTEMNVYQTPYYFVEDLDATYSAVKKNFDVWNCIYDRSTCDDIYEVYGTCWADNVLGEDCFDSLRCQVICEERADDDNCADDCQKTIPNTEQSLDTFYAIIFCSNDVPDRIRDIEHIRTECAKYFDACYATADCDVISGGCDAGEVCVLSAYGDPVCRKSDNKDVGEACRVGTGDCAEGLTCAPNGEILSVCAKLCTQQSDCGELACNKDAQTAHWLGEDVGYCTSSGEVCIDKDNDGYCVERDCDDNNNQVHPDSQEICGNGIDDDCNGQTDEGCGSVDDGGSESDAGDAGEETDAADAVVIDDATAEDGGDAGSDDASSTSGDSGSSDKPSTDDASRPSSDDAGSADGDEVGGDDGCSAVPGTRSSSWLAFLGLPLLAIRRRRRA